MKPKKVLDKLSVKKITIANLGNAQMREAQAGERLTPYCTNAWGQTCDDCPTVTYCTWCINCNTDLITYYCNSVNCTEEVCPTRYGICP